MIMSAATLSALGQPPEGGIDGVCQEICLRSAKLSCGGRKFEIVLSQASGEGDNVDDVGRGVEVENYDVVEAGGYALEVVHDLVDGLDEPTGHGAPTLRHDRPLEESGRGAEGGEGYDGVLADGDLMGRRHEVEQRDDAPFFPGSLGPRRRGEWKAG